MKPFDTNLLGEYKNYRDQIAIVTRKIMTSLPDYIVTIDEEPDKKFRINFYSRSNANNDTTVLITLDQLLNIDTTLTENIIPALSSSSTKQDEVTDIENACQHPLHHHKPNQSEVKQPVDVVDVVQESNYYAVTSNAVYIAVKDLITSDMLLASLSEYKKSKDLPTDYIQRKEVEAILDSYFTEHLSDTVKTINGYKPDENGNIFFDTLYLLKQIDLDLADYCKYDDAMKANKNLSDNIDALSEKLYGYTKIAEDDTTISDDGDIAKLKSLIADNTEKITSLDNILNGYEEIAEDGTVTKHIGKLEDLESLITDNTTTITFLNEKLYGYEKTDEDGTTITDEGDIAKLETLITNNTTEITSLEDILNVYEETAEDGTVTKHIGKLEDLESLITDNTEKINEVSENLNNNYLTTTEIEEKISASEESVLDTIYKKEYVTHKYFETANNSYALLLKLYQSIDTDSIIKKSDLSDYLTKEESDKRYVASNALDSLISSYVSVNNILNENRADELYATKKDYLKTSDVSTAINALNVAKKDEIDEINNTLTTSYVTKSDLNTKLSYYTKESEVYDLINDIVSKYNYVTTNTLDTFYHSLIDIDVVTPTTTTIDTTNNSVFSYTITKATKFVFNGGKTNKSKTITLAVTNNNDFTVEWDTNIKFTGNKPPEEVKGVCLFTFTSYNGNVWYCTGSCVNAG